MELQTYAEIVTGKWAELVDHILGWDIYNEISIDIIPDVQGFEERAKLLHNGILWASIYHLKNGPTEFETYTINPLYLEENIANDKHHLSNLISKLAALIDATYVNDVECITYTQYSDEQEM